MRARTEAVANALLKPKFLSLPENRAARLALRRLAVAVRNHRRLPFQMLFLHGPTGVGKSHLASWLQRACRACATHKSVAADWPDDVSEMQGVELLIVEDLQHLPARAAASLTALLDRRAARQRPTLLTANRGPAELALPVRIVSRCAAGLVVGIAPPTSSSRRRLLERFARQRQLALAPDVLGWLAEQPVHSVRQLQAVVQRFADSQQQSARPLGVAAICDDGDSIPRTMTVDAILEHVARLFDVTVAELRDADRHPRLTLPRHVAMHLTRQRTGLSLAQIGDCFGGRDARTVQHACDKIEAARTTDAWLAATIRQLEHELA